MAEPTILCGNGAWIMKEKYVRKVQAADIETLNSVPSSSSS
jgi:hypothetical protein